MKSRYILLSLALLLALPAAQAQVTFDVTVEAKSATHPNAGQGHPDAFVIDGEEANALVLTRGETYVFQMNGVPSIHPFYLSTSESGGGAGAYTDGVTGSQASGNEMLTFTVPEDAPDLLYYQCFNHQFMGWEINVIDPGLSSEDGAQPLALALDAAYPNPFTTATRLNVTLDEAQAATVAVFDLAGRRVRTLHAGPLAAGSTPFEFAADGLAPGTYVVRVVAGEAVREQRVTLAR